MESALIRQRLNLAATRADLDVAVSCFCARGKVPNTKHSVYSEAATTGPQRDPSAARNLVSRGPSPGRGITQPARSAVEEPPSRRCPCCRKQVTAPAPKGFEPGSPFGPGLCALIIHLHVTQAISFERLVRLLAEVFGLTISEGAIANILARAEAPLLAAAAPIADAVRASPVVGSDETSARVGGKNWWQWVLLGSTAICHVIADTRAASVVTTFMNGARPEVWVADRYGGQLGHGAVRQMCLAHLLRDAAYAIDEGDEGRRPVHAPRFAWGGSDPTRCRFVTRLEPARQQPRADWPPVVGTRSALQCRRLQTRSHPV